MLCIAPTTEATKPGLRGEHEGNRKTIAQGMFLGKNINKINSESGLCPPLCRDLRKQLASNLSWRQCTVSGEEFLARSIRRLAPIPAPDDRHCLEP
jgi:hypothetical protein